MVEGRWIRQKHMPLAMLADAVTALTHTSHVIVLARHSTFLHPPHSPTTHHTRPPLPPTTLTHHTHPPHSPTTTTHHPHPPLPPTTPTHHTHPPTTTTHHYHPPHSPTTLTHHYHTLRYTFYVHTNKWLAVIVFAPLWSANSAVPVNTFSRNNSTARAASSQENSFIPTPLTRQAQPSLPETGINRKESEMGRTGDGDGGFGRSVLQNGHCWQMSGRRTCYAHSTVPYVCMYTQWSH